MKKYRSYDGPSGLSRGLVSKAVFLLSNREGEMIGDHLFFDVY